MEALLYKTILSIAGVVIMIMLGIIGYFLKKQVDATETLEATVKTLNVTVNLLQSDQSYVQKSCTQRHAVVDKRLDDHSKNINSHAVEIAELKIATSHK